MRHAFLSLILTGLPAAVFAECPVAADLAGGVRFEMAEGASWDIRASGGRDREVTFVWDTAFSAQTITFWDGAYMTRIVSDDSEFVSDVDYVMPVRRAPPPGPGAQWTVDIRNSSADGPLLRADFVFGAEQSVTHGSCSYDMIPLTLTQGPASEDGRLWTYQYYPEFGAVVIVADGYGTTWQVTGVSAR